MRFFFEKRKTDGWYDRRRWAMKDRCEWKDVNYYQGYAKIRETESGKEKENVDPGLNSIRNKKGQGGLNLSKPKRQECA